MKAKMIKLQVICKMNRQLCHEDKQAICPCSCKVTFSSEGDDVTLPFEFPEYQGWFDGDTLNLECKKDVALEAYEGMAETLKEIKKVEDLSFVSENGNNLLPIEVKSFELSIKFDTSEVEKGFTLPWLTGECTKTFEAKVVALKDVKPLDLYWMNRDQQGLYESGYLLTAEQLRAEVQGGAWEYLTEHPTEEYVGKYRDDDTFIVKKVRSAEEIRELMTWKNFDPQESCASGEFDEGWPIFVDKRYRLDRYIYEFTGYTYMTLPSGDENPTVKEWMERLGLTEEDILAMRLKWGSAYRPEEWVQLEKLYQEMMDSYDIQTAGHIDTLKKVCKTSLKADQLLDIGDIDGAQKAIKMYDMLMKSGKFTAAQNKAESGEFVDSISEIVLVCERDGFIPRYYTDGPQDKVDYVIKDFEDYASTLVKEELQLGPLIERAIKQIEEEKEAERHAELMEEDEDEEAAFEKQLFNEESTDLSDEDFEEFNDFIEKSVQEDVDYYNQRLREETEGQ